VDDLERAGQTQRQPAATEELGMAGGFEGETVTRRRLITASAHSAGAIAAAAFTLPVLGFALGPVFDRASDTWQDIGPLRRFANSDYVPVPIAIAAGVGEAGRSIAYVRRHNPQTDGAPRDRYDHVVAISSRCVHVGCPVRYAAAAQSFICPCHGGVYDFRGLRIGGPPPRPLDRFYTLVRDGRVLLGPRYSVNNELRRFAPRDPGEPLDGVGPYLYPPRFSTAPAPPGARR
jgi:Rieske Fe-S protein